ncbi:ferredoxin--NADP reductase [Algoriphagus aestuariicola]|jgi:ring-1,2-phenylacetyl-CoA epoxidase subunit PaaE|uniref:Ferredoxin--NADP reductase n=1 Tax=Algoriphagus aestuariicola TaxID=1852016 RepID=A0ABS3BJZ0_9BACT|nr:ferredoxin--NADP reductase [Algoriphagus aestuariicola]MBN7799592.1 ferredoxin--NADP reductase [Algoriphagus aestuariicola]
MFNFFKKKKEEVKVNPYLPLKVREVVRETADTVTLFFEQPEPFLDYKPGQFLTLVMDFEGKEQRRSYSLCTSPFVDPFPGISIKRVPDGLFSNFLNEKIFPGKTINVLKPLGHFTTDFHSKNKRHFFLLAAGSGITPLMGILKSVLVNEPDSIVTLIYCSRNEEQIIFKNQLGLLEKANPDRLKVIHNLSQPSASWTGLKGRLSAGVLRELFAKAEYEQRYEEVYFMCGPEEIMNMAKGILSDLGVDKERIHQESFYSAAAHIAHDEALAGISHGILSRDVTIILDGEEELVTVDPSKTVLEAGLAAGLNMPYSCQSGLCTACRGRLLSGQVKMDEDAGLSEKELAAGYVLCCVSRPLTDDIKITIE